MKPQRWRHRVAPAAIAGLAALAGASPVRSQPPELVTDRPDQTESTALVPPGSVQIEAGATWSRSESAGVEVDTNEIASTLVRIGLNEGLELRLGWGGWVDLDADSIGGDANGAADAGLGLKLRIAEEAGSRPAMALIAGVSLPVGDGEVSSERADPGLLLSASHTLSDTVGLGYNVGAAWESGIDDLGERDTLYSWVYSVAVGFGVYDKLSAFGEVFGRVPGSSGGRSEMSLDAGLTYLLRSNFQLDVAAGLGVSGDAPDWFLGVGFSLRLPE